jgi:hypothetical protein
MVLPPLEYPSILAPAAEGININSQIMAIYLNSLLPGEAQQQLVHYAFRMRLLVGQSDQLLAAR